jgi:Ca-activated chloride channel family protein
MFRFEDTIYLYLLLVIPILGVVYLFGLYRSRKKLKKAGDIELLKDLMPDVSVWRPVAKFCLLLTALALMIIMLARPQFGTKINNEKRTGIETIIAMDISNSMLAEDVVPSRLDRSKMMVENLVDNFNDDKIGLIVFAGDAFVQLPITSDYVSAKMFLESIDPSMMASQGTDAAAAINMAVNSFTHDEGVGKAIILITDGEDHEGGALEAAANAKEKGMRVYVLGVGSPKGAPIPIPGTNDFMTDNSGKTVMSALNEEMCKQIASAGGGVYIHVDNNSNAQLQLNNELDKLAKKEMETTIYSEYDDQFQAVCIIVLLLLIIEVCILERKNPIFRKFSLFGKKAGKASMIIIFLMTSAVSFAQTDRDYVREGNRHFRKGNFAEAEVSYRKAQEKNVNNPQASYNLANSMFAQRKDSAAIVQFEQAVKSETNPYRKAQSYHNIGVVCQGHKMFGEAIEAYKNALRLNPNDHATRYNLELCRRQMKNQNQNQQQQGENNKDGEDEKKEEKKQQEQKEEQKQNEKDEQKQDKNQMSKDNAEQLLKAAMQKEKKTQERMQKLMQQPRSRKLDKNW